MNVMRVFNFFTGSKYFGFTGQKKSKKIENVKFSLIVWLSMRNSDMLAYLFIYLTLATKVVDKGGTVEQSCWEGVGEQRYWGWGAGEQSCWWRGGCRCAKLLSNGWGAGEQSCLVGEGWWIWQSCSGGMLLSRVVGRRCWGEKLFHKGMWANS